MKIAKRLLDERRGLPSNLRGRDFDAWLIPIILDCLEPFQRQILDVLLQLPFDEFLTYRQLVDVFESTRPRIGSALSDLSKLGLISRGDNDEGTIHYAAMPWVLSAWQRHEGAHWAREREGEE